MLSKEDYISASLELHLFFARIMKEHGLFLAAGFTCKNSKLVKEADNYKVCFEKVLMEVVKLSDGRLGQSIIDSGEIVTPYTLDAEAKTREYTGIDINCKITVMEKDLECKNTKSADKKTVGHIKEINNKVIKLLDGLIEFKKKVLNEVLCCKLYTTNYPSLIDHLIREAELYRLCVREIEADDYNEGDDIKKTELFWNEIMMEHSQFIRGMLDPSEAELIETADDFSKRFAKLNKKEDSVAAIVMAEVKDSLAEAVKLRDFKKSGVKGILDCKIKSIILPLLNDHVLREANHYIRLLKIMCK